LTAATLAYRTKQEHKIEHGEAAMATLTDGAGRRALLEDLRAKIGRIERGRGADAGTVALDGGGPLDRALPWGGLPRGALHEVAMEGAGAAGIGFAAALAIRFAGISGVVFWIATRLGEIETGLPYPPGLAALGLDPARLLHVRAARARDALWAAEEALRSGKPAATLIEVEDVDLVAGRRLQLAAEAGGLAGLLLRPAQRTEASAALSRWQVAPAAPAPAWHLRLRARGGAEREWDRIEWDHATHRFRVAAALADRSDRAPQTRRVG
jgi:protein ImuA